MAILSFPNNDKQMYLDRVRRHREADELIRGTDWEDGRGCAVGCTLETYDHSLYPELLGVPEQLAHLQDWLFENLPENHLTWPERFLSAIPEQVDLSRVYSQWVVRLLNRRLASLGDGNELWRLQVRYIVEEVKELFSGGILAEKSAWARAWTRAWVVGKTVGKTAEKTAGAAAWAAAWASRGVGFAGESAGAAAWASRGVGFAGESARAAEITQQANDLIELLSTTK